MRREQHMRATIIKQDGPYHMLLHDERGDRRWVMLGRFKEGVDRDAGNIVMLEYRDGTWYATRNANP